MRATSVFLTLLLAVTIAAAQPGKRGPMGFGKERMEERLKLTSEQEKQFDKLHSDLQKKQIAQRSKMETLRLEIRDLMREDKPDRGKIESKISDIGKAQNEMKLSHIGFWFDVNKILTSEQQSEWKERGFFPMHGGPMGGPKHRLRGGDCCEQGFKGGRGHRCDDDDDRD